MEQPEWTEKAQQKEMLEIKTRELFEMNKHSYGTRRLSDALTKHLLSAVRAYSLIPAL